MRRAPTITALATAGLLALACASAKPSPVVRIKPEYAVKHARGEQVGIAALDGAPDVVRLHTTSSVTQWVYCGGGGGDGDGWVRVVDFDANGDVLVSLDLLGDDGSACPGAAGPTPAASRRRRGEP